MTVRTGEVERLRLDAGSWVDVGRSWIDPAVADALYQALASGARWSQGQLWRYERHVAEPRLTAPVHSAGPEVVASVAAAEAALRRRYRVPLLGPGLLWYRDGSDGIAFHRDRDLRHLEDTLVAVLTLGGPRPFLLRSRRAARGARSLAVDRGEAEGALDLAPASGDLLVMGGRCQADWEHAVPRRQQPTTGRMSLQWRWTSGRGRPEVGPSYRAPRTFSR